MPFHHKFVDPFPFERFDRMELIKLVQQKEQEGWEMVKPIFSVERGTYHEVDGRVKWVAVMTRVKKSID